MVMKKPISLIVAIMVLMTAVFTGCGAKSDPTASTTQSTSAVTATTSAAQENGALPLTKEKVTLRVVSTDNRYQPKSYAQELPVFTELEKKTNVKIKMEPIPDAQWGDVTKTMRSLREKRNVSWTNSGGV